MNRRKFAVGLGVLVAGIKKAVGAVESTCEVVNFSLEELTPPSDSEFYGFSLGDFDLGVWWRMVSDREFDFFLLTLSPKYPSYPRTMTDVLRSIGIIGVETSDKPKYVGAEGIGGDLQSILKEIRLPRMAVEAVWGLPARFFQELFARVRADNFWVGTIRGEDQGDDGRLYVRLPTGPGVSVAELRLQDDEAVFVTLSQTEPGLATAEVHLTRSGLCRPGRPNVLR